MKKIILGAVLLHFLCFVQAAELSEESDTSKIVRPFQLSFISPLGTNGLESGLVTNKFSINILAGYAGGLDGIEFGGFANTIKGDMTGAQFAGFGNYVNGQSQGAQFAGFYNCSRKYLKGTQMSGFVNAVLDSAEVFQAAGFVNVVNGKTKGTQLAGFVNTGNKGIEGFQAAGFINVSADSTKGAQIAGFANVSTKEIHGAQVAGFINYAPKVKGVQIGFINVADSIDGLGIGFLNFVRHGYNKIEIEGSSGFHLSTNVKLGSSLFYNILSSGINFQNTNQLYWGWGYGIGSLIPVNEKLSVNVDAVSYHINEDEWFTDEVNLLNKLKINGGYTIFNKITIYGGPTLDVWVSNIKNMEGKIVGSEMMPNQAIFERTKRETMVKITTGFNVGLRF